MLKLDDFKFREHAFAADGGCWWTHIVNDRLGISYQQKDHGGRRIIRVLTHTHNTPSQIGPMTLTDRRRLKRLYERDYAKLMRRALQGDLDAKAWLQYFNKSEV